MQINFIFFSTKGKKDKKKYQNIKKVSKYKKSIKI